MNGMKYYGRDGEPIPLEEWAALLEAPDGRRVASTNVTTPTGAHLLVSTVLIGLDMNYTNEGPPIIFETMTFNQDAEPGQQWAEIETRRYPTERDALAGHAEVVAWLTDFGYEPHAINPMTRAMLLREAQASVALDGGTFVIPEGEAK